MGKIEIDIHIEKLKEQIRHFDKLILLSEKKLRAKHEDLSLEYSNDCYLWAEKTIKQLESLIQILEDLKGYNSKKNRHQDELSHMLRMLEKQK